MSGRRGPTGASAFDPHCYCLWTVLLFLNKVCWSSIRCWLLVCWPTSLGWWYAGPALGVGCRCAGRPAWDAGVLADQPWMLVCWPTHLGFPVISRFVV
ncbi:uncharacterized [Tachysurus ichikawai]